ncbi:MAG TPA: efflux RND transporter periplasmic adaptor subunit [Terracidiphilus sp.]|jgi:Cu(I)/Ag(I) efflux system membrane fusion protein
MAKQALYLIPVAGALALGFAFGHFHQRPAEAATRNILYYVDPMHPAYHSSKPGTAPDCGMDLVPVYADGVGKSLAGSEAAGQGGLAIDTSAQKMYGIQLAKVEKNSGKHTLQAFGRVAVDETRIYRINMGTDGYVKETHDDAVGNFVKKNQHLAVVYSPEFLSVEGGYLSANERTTGSVKDTNPAAMQNSASAQARADRLRNLGMSDVQIEEMSTNRKIPEDVYVVSPTDGFIISRNITSGLRFERQRELYTVADLKHIWILAEVFGKDAEKFRPGTMASVTVADTGTTIQARVSDVLPQVDPATRALKVRLEAENPGYKLRPDMLVNVELPVAVPAGLSVPADAIVDSGLAKQVFVQTSPGRFEKRQVEIGWRFDDQVQIVKGLKEGETIVSAGTFLVDSESRLQAAAGSNGSSAAAPRADSALEHHMN